MEIYIVPHRGSNGLLSYFVRKKDCHFMYDEFAHTEKQAIEKAKKMTVKGKKEIWLCKETSGMIFEQIPIKEIKRSEMRYMSHKCRKCGKEVAGEDNLGKLWEWDREAGLSQWGYPCIKPHICEGDKEKKEIQKIMKAFKVTEEKARRMMLSANW